MSQEDEASLGYSSAFSTDVSRLKSARNGFFTAMALGITLMWHDALTAGTFNSAVSIVVSSGLVVYFASYLHYREKGCR